MSDDHVTRRTVLKLTGSGAVLATLGAPASGTNHKALTQESELRAAAKQHVAAETGLSVEQLVIETDAMATYDALEARYYDAKVRDTDEGSLYGVMLDAAGEPVDRANVRQAASDAYRDQHGKLGKQLHDRLGEADRYTVDVWLNGIDRGAAQAAVGLDNRPNDASTKAALASEYRSRVGQKTAALADAIDRMPDAEVIERGNTAEIVTVRASESAIDRLQARADVWLVLDGEGASGQQLNSAAKTHDSFEYRNGAYDATGQAVGIFEYSGYPDTTHLNRPATYPNDSASVRAHADIVAMCAAGTDDTEPGIASGADVYAAQDPNNNLSDKVSWLVNQGVSAMNFSFYYGANGTRKIASADLRWGQWVINNYTTVTKAVGNQSDFGNLITTTPAKGFNTLSVGATDDKDTGSDQTDDELDSYSCYKNPRSEHDTPSSDYYPHTKPEVSAVGSRISTPPYSASSGTSFSGPHLAGLAALVSKFSADYGRIALDVYPEVIKPLAMACATNTGDSSYQFEKMGAGTIVARQAEEIVANKWFRSDTFDKSNSKQTYTFNAQSGETVRLGLTWLSDVTASDFSDLTNARSDLDLDLQVNDPSGNYVAGSASYDRGFEFTEFTAPTSGQFEIVVNKFDWQASSSTRFFGLAWHRS